MISAHTCIGGEAESQGGAGRTVVGGWGVACARAGSTCLLVGWGSGSARTSDGFLDVVEDEVHEGVEALECALDCNWLVSCGVQRERGLSMQQLDR